jgi:hypothetical protein
MSQPTRWLDDPQRTDAQNVVALAASVPPREVDLHTWDDVLARAAVAPRGPRLVPTFAVSALFGVLLVLGARGLSKPAPSASPSPVLMASDTTRWRQEAGDVVVLESGRLSLPTPTSQVVRVRTPHVSIEARASRFLADVALNGTVVLVEEGEVVVRVGGQERRLRAGESLTWPPAPTVPENLLVRPSELGCSEVPAGERLGCLQKEAQGTDLTAQAALYEVGALELRAGHPAAARAAWRSSLERFGSGVLHPEVRLALLVELVRARDFGAALDVAREFERTCADDARVEDVRQLRVALEALPH